MQKCFILLILGHFQRESILFHEGKNVLFMCVLYFSIRRFCTCIYVYFVNICGRQVYQPVYITYILYRNECN